jgi:type VI secretion system secreted protein VgrG
MRGSLSGEEEMSAVHPSDPTVLSLRAALAHYTDGTRLIRLATPLGIDLLAECVRGEEGISQGYRFRIDALCTHAHLPLKSFLGQPVLLQLLTSTGRRDLRPFHGHILSAEICGSNGGFARYVLTIAPWSAFLGYGRDSRTFQDMDVFEIMDTVFRSYRHQGKLRPAWRYDIVDRSVYPKRSLTTQYRESDLAFVERLMHEEGLFHFFEHASESDSPALGSHTMVIADDNRAFKPNRQAEVRFSKPGAVIRDDTVDRWRFEVLASVEAVEMRSWDYRARHQRQVIVADGWRDNMLTSRDTPGAYAFHTHADGQRIADNQLQAMQVQSQTHTCTGTVRTLAPGSSFTLRGHPMFDRADSDAGRHFVAVRVRHLMNNNLSAELLDGVRKLLGAGVVASEETTTKDWRAPGTAVIDRPLYRNRAELIPAQLAYRCSGVDGHGRFLHPRPTVYGQQTAVVVGPKGAVVHTDRDHRVKVQFHWQRGVASHSRLQHPAPAGHTGAPGDDTAGTWVRVMTPFAGANWGTNFVPRVGQEVLVDFLEGDIDRPVVIGSLYNGRGREDAQHNQVNYGAGPVTGNAPAWFPGERGGHGHPATLSGIKSQAMQASQEGIGAYSQLVFDDSAGQARLSVQVHAKPRDGSAELNLGHLRHQNDNQRLETVGQGVELKAEHSVAFRAGQGLLLSSDARSQGSGDQLDTREAQEQIESGRQLQVDLATRALKHRAGLKGEPGPSVLPAVAEMERTGEIVKEVVAGRTGATAVAYGEPLLQLSSPAGIFAVTPASAVLAAGTTGSVTAGQDINVVTQGNAAMSVIGGIGLFTYGKANNKNKPNQETGIRMHAASGKVSSQSQSGPTQLLADKAVTVASVTKSVTVAAPKKHVLLTALGAYIKLEGGNIELHAPGKVEFKATMKEFAGPKSATRSVESPKVAQLKLCEMRAAGAANAGDSVVPLE